MTPKDALDFINKELRKINTNADVHDLYREAVVTIAQALAAAEQQDNGHANEPVPELKKEVEEKK